jgi:antitoxin component of MazEF toxin-antitoxin module
MGQKTKVQLIRRKDSQSWYIMLPLALAKALDFKKGEVVEWSVKDAAHLGLRRCSPRGKA